MATSIITTQGYSIYDVGVLPATSTNAETGITKTELVKWKYITICLVISNNDSRNIASTTIPVGILVASGELQFEVPFNTDGSLVAVVKCTNEKLYYNTGSGGWKCRIILSR